MTSKERMITTLEKKKPDRLPATIHQWMPYHLKYYMDKMDDIEAFRATGLDGAITFSPQVIPENSEWQDIILSEHSAHGKFEQKRIIRTPSGKLYYGKGGNEMTTWLTEEIIKHDEDIYLLKKHLPIPRLDRAEVLKKYDALGDDGILRGLIMGQQGGCWQDAVEYVGTENLILATFDKPDWVHELLNILLEKKLEFIYTELKGAKYDLIENGGGAASGNVISPAIHEEFCTPYDRKLHDALHDIGLPVVYHTCGGMVKIAHLIPENHCDASETLSPPGVGGDITPENQEALYQTLFPKVALIGGLDQNYVLEQGTTEDIHREVYRLFEAFGKNGGYMMSASDRFFHAPRENLEAFAAAAAECVY